MKILHVCLACFYIDNYSYQENMLPKYHKKMGHKVKILASTVSFDKTGAFCNVEPGVYKNSDGIEVTRVDYKKGVFKAINKHFRKYEPIYEYIEEFKPDIIFVHGCQFSDIEIIKRYAENNRVTVFVDNHADFSNSARNILSIIIHKTIWKKCAHKILPYAKKFYGVLPARVSFLQNVYNIPKEKTELLVMGADDEIINEIDEEKVRLKIRSKLGIPPKAFVIVTGGKIDYAKMQTFTFLDAIKKIEGKVYVVIFGTIANNLRSRLDAYLNNEIKFVGWLNHKQIYELLVTSDLAVFPGRHSVLWEESAGLGIPMVVKKWDGTDDIDNGNNVLFIANDTQDDIEQAIRKAISPKYYAKMEKDAKSKITKNKFLYSNIAKQSIK